MSSMFCQTATVCEGMDVVKKKQTNKKNSGHTRDSVYSTFVAAYEALTNPCRRADDEIYVTWTLLDLCDHLHVKTVTCAELIVHY